MAEKLTFETTLKELPVVIDKENYTLRELDGQQKGKYLNQMGSRIELGADGKVSGFKDYAGLESTLLSLCLYNAEGVPVSKNVIDSWPSSMLTRLFDAAQELSGLNETGRKAQEDEAKNS